MAIRVLLADDHAVVRDGLRLILEAEPDMVVVGSAADGYEAVFQAKGLEPDIVVMDIAMPKLNGVEATRQIRQDCPAARVVILSMHSTSEHISRSLQAGARGYLLKESAGAEVVAAVRAVQAGRCYLSREIVETVVADYARFGEGAPGKSPLECLSPREREVLRWVAEGRSSREIAAGLFLSVKTVETYRSRLMRKLGLSDLPSLVKFAIRHGLIAAP